MTCKNQFYFQGIHLSNFLNDVYIQNGEKEPKMAARIIQEMTKL